MTELDALLEQIRCEFKNNPFFSEADLAELDACLPTSEQIEASAVESISDEITEDPCAKKTIDAVGNQIKVEQEKIKEQVKAKYVISRLQELKYLLFPAEFFYSVRQDYFNKISTKLDQRFKVVKPGGKFTQKWIDKLSDVDYLKWATSNSEFTKKSYSEIISDVKKESGLDFDKIKLWFSTSAVNQAQKVISINEIAYDYFNPKADSEIKKYFSLAALSSTGKPITRKPAITFLPKNLSDLANPNFLISLPGRDEILVPSSQIDQTGQTDSAGNSQIFSKKIFVKILPLDPKYKLNNILNSKEVKFLNLESQSYVDIAASDKKYPYIGLLANFYKKIEDPLLLFTLKERGLTTEKLKVDKNLSKEKLDGLVKEQRANGTEDQFYIENVEIFQEFYKGLDEKIEKKIEDESLKFKKDLYTSRKFENLEKLAILQVIDLVEKGQLEKSPTQDIIVNGRTLKPTLEATSILDIINKPAEALNTYIKLIDEAIDRLKKEFKPNPADFERALNETGCVPPAENPCPELPQAGQDPLGYIGTTLNQTSANPDYTCNCYWKEVTKHLNKLNLLPIPDISRLPALRYWPIGLLIPTPVPIRIPFPQIWKHIVTLNFPFGTLVVWYIQCGILPSPVVLFIGPDGKKIILLSYRALQGQFDTVGYTINESAKGILGVEQTSIGKPSGTSVKTNVASNIILSAGLQKAARGVAIAQAAYDIASSPGVLMPNGFSVPFKLGEQKGLKTGDSDLLNQITDGLEDFEVFVRNLGRKITTKIDELGDIEMPNFTFALTSAEAAAKNNKEALEKIKESLGLSNNYNFNEAWLNCDPNNLSNNINSQLGTSLPVDALNSNKDADSRCKEMVIAMSIDLSNFIDKLKLGSYTIPKERGKAINPQQMLDGVIESVIEYLSSLNNSKKVKTFNLNKKIRKAISDLEIDAKIDQFSQTIDLSNSKSVKAFKDSLKSYVDEIVDIFSGKNIKPNRKSAAFNRLVDREIAKRKRFNQKNADFDKKFPNLSKNTQQYEAKIGKPTPRRLPIDFKTVSDYVYDREVKKREGYAKILGFTVIGLTKPIQDAASDLTKVVKGSCCPKPLNIPQFIDPVVLGLLMSFKQLAYKAIDAITTGLLQSLLGPVFTLTRQIVQNITMLITKNIPDIDLPLNGAAALQLLVKLLKPFLPLLRVPLPPAARSLGIPQITLNLDAIVKPLLKNAISSLINLILSKIPIKICDLPIKGISTAIITSIYRGVKSALKSTILQLISTILAPLQSIFNLLKIIKSVKGAFTSLFDTTNPFLKIYKTLKELLERALPTPAFLKQLDKAALLAQLELLKVMNSGVKSLPEIAVYLPISAGAALSLGNVLRVGSHPLFNQDDLPSWERLSLKNPLYVLFLDDLAHKAKAATGTIFGQDIIGNPVYVPTP